MIWKRENMHRQTRSDMRRPCKKWWQLAVRKWREGTLHLWSRATKSGMVVHFEGFREIQFIKHIREDQLRGCVCYDRADHWTHEFKRVTLQSQRKRIHLLKSLCFNCIGTEHKATEFRSRRRCLVCKRKHHTSTCDSDMPEKWMTAAQAGDSPVVYPVVVKEGAGVKCRRY